MLPQWIIERKRDGHALTNEELASFITGYVRGDIPDYQAAALTMAIFFRGMSPAETASLTRIMMQSGETIDTSSIITPKIDKHSTGGIGDKISIPLAPLVASCGVTIPMIAGRGLGLTGGTIDKLESIPGYRVNLTASEFIATLKACGCSIIGQSEQLVPADRKLYALRDVTATVPSIPLIVSSIMSKKLAEGIDGLVLDVKSGSGAFMQSLDSARTLAKALITVGQSMGKRVSALITNMDQPLGRSVGNALEIKESIDILRGRGPSDSTDLTLHLGAEMLTLAGLSPSPAAALPLLQRKLESGAPLEVLRSMIRLQGGNADIVDNHNLLPASPIQHPLPAPSTGYIASVDAGKIGRAALLLGAGRAKTTDTIDYAAGLSALVKIGDHVIAGQPLTILHAATPERITAALPLVQDAITIISSPVTPPPLILERL
jgi:pyrimidine-nucleoside phosphorylase